MVEGWTEAGDSVRWKIDVVEAGRYEVVLSYGCAPADAGSTFRVGVARAGAGGADTGTPSVEGVTEPTAGRDVYRPRVIGSLELPKGQALLEIKPVKLAGSELMSLHKVWLRRLPVDRSDK